MTTGIRPSGADNRTASVLAALRAHPAGDAREARSIERIRAELHTLEHPFDRSADHRHVTASAIAVGTRGVLLHRHRRIHRWLQPGGHLDPCEWPAAAARRECEEETGLPVRHPPEGPLLIHVDVHDASDGHVHLDLRYLIAGPDAEPAPPAGESQEVAWFTWVEAEALADVALAGALQTARQHLDARDGQLTTE